MTREEWLLASIQHLTPLFTAAGADIPDLRISVGWPGGRGPKRHVVGQCWNPITVEDKTPAIFISPVLKDPIEVLETVAHELVHACGEQGHRGGFARLASKVGMVKPWKSAPAGDELRQKLTRIGKILGPYPHAVINPGDRPVTQTTRMLKVVCPDCGYTCRTTQKWLDVGTPMCPCGTRMDAV